MTTQTHERRYFPAPDVVRHDNGIRVESYRRDDTEVRVSFLAPGAVSASPDVEKAQVGMVSEVNSP